MRFADTIRPLLMASLMSVLVQTIFAMSFQDAPLGLGLLFVEAVTWCLTLVAVTMFVIPIMAVAPRLRQPTYWLAAVWGTSVGWLFLAILFRDQSLPSPLALAQLAVVGASGGVVYALLARRKPVHR